jgi:hypothetical protein
MEKEIEVFLVYKLIMSEGHTEAYIRNAAVHMEKCQTRLIWVVGEEMPRFKWEGK